MTPLFALVLFFQQSKLPEGSERSVVIKSCGTCHSAEVVLNNYNSKQGWTDLVDEMISRGAVANAKERKQIIAYLSRHFPLRPN